MKTREELEKAVERTADIWDGICCAYGTAYLKNKENDK